MALLWITTLPLNLIKTVSKEQNLEWRYLAAIVYQESKGESKTARYEPNYRYTHSVHMYANSLGITPFTEEQFQKTSFGLCQLMGGTARALGFNGHPGDLYDELTNLRLAAKLLKQLQEKYGEPRKIFASYNAGSPIYLKDGSTFINQAYVDSVSKLVRELEDGIN